MFRLMNDSDWANEDLQRVEKCYKLLLDADSDISSVTHHGDPARKNWVSAFWIALYECTLVRLPYRDRSMQCS